MSDDKSLADRLKGGFNTAGKVTLLTGIGAAVLLKSVKEMVVGDPPSPIRKTLVYGTAALAIGYTACEDEINTVGSKAYNYLEGEQAQQIESLEEKTTRQQTELHEARTVNDSLRDEMASIQQAYRARVDSLLDAYQEAIASEQKQRINDQLDSVRHDYNAAIRSLEDASQDTVILKPGTEESDDSGDVLGPGDTRITPQESKHCWHPVQPDETLSGLANEYLDDPDQHTMLQAYNKIDRPEHVPIGYPVELPATTCPAKTTKRPDFLVMERSASLYDDLKTMTSTPSKLLRYNAERGNDLTETETGQRIAVYTP